MSERNKKIAVAFYNKLINEFDAAGAFAQYGGETYIQHTPGMADGQEGVTRFISWLRSSYPESHMEIKRAFSDGDIVILHCHWVRSPGDGGDAVVDFFRVKDGKVVEHWDVIQPVPTTAANTNTMF
jgi:predicted SnoaL-like aldol condensation-catalyzing enzyme